MMPADAQEELALEKPFEWPRPPYFAFAPGSEKTGPEACLIYYADGRKTLGNLIQLSPRESFLTVQLNRTETNETVQLDQIKSIRLVQPLMLKRQPASLEARAEEVFPPSEKQSFTVEYADGEILSGDTVGTSVSDNGLFLYLPVEEGRIVRCFVPSRAIRNYQIGAPIGEMLIEEKLASKGQVTEALQRQSQLRSQRIGEYLTENRILSRESLAAALKHQEGKPILKLGEALQQLGLLTGEQLKTALEKQQANRKLPLGQILVEMGVVDERTLKGVLAKKLGVPYVGLARFNVDPNAVKLVGGAFARARLLMPLYIDDNALIAAFENPLSAKAIDELRFMTQMRVVPVMSSRDDILSAIGEHYGNQGSVQFAPAAPEERRARDDYEFHKAAAGELRIDELALKLAAEERPQDIEYEQVAECDSTLVQLVNKMILDAYRDGVSDIHVETYPGKQNTRVRFRKDGSLIDYFEIPSNFRSAVVSRIKIMSQLDISERRKPQDGKLDFQQFGPAKLELRVATIPTANGLEDVVMRLLAGAKPIPMDQLGLEPGAFAALTKVVEKPYGLILVCGPTGSGKTTTLHSLLGYINTPGRKIWTAEDPVEITQRGLRQVQVHPKIGWTFAAAMRSFLRADPDVIMVGEMRDQETAKTAIEASLTGHLVLSTLHTNSAPESIVRLLDLGMDPFNFADALLAVLAQRLAKGLCPACKSAYQPSKSELAELAEEYCEGFELEPAKIIKQWGKNAGDGEIKLYHSGGCEQCNQSGYRGRIALHELLTGSAAIRKRVQARAPVEELFAAAIAAGMRTLKQDGIGKVILGRTSMAQVRAVCA